jgi:acetyl/propionyl-CoA carboxylase alpha subunit
MLGKLVVHGVDRAQAIERCMRALRELRIVGVRTSLPIALRTMQSTEFRSGDYDTGILERIDKTAATVPDELAMLAAAAARFLVAERAGASTAARSGAGDTVPAWATLGRTERLRRTAP